MRVERKNVVIVGSGGFAREAKWLLEQIDQMCGAWNFLGFIDNKREVGDIAGGDSYILNCKEELYVVIAIGNPAVRQRLHRSYQRNKNIIFPNLIHPSVRISDHVQMGEGNIICAGNIVTVDIEIGDCCIVNLNCTIGHDSRIGSYVTVNPGTNISGNVTIAQSVEIGTGSKIIQGICVGERSVIGAGAVVIRDIPAGCTAVGVPARVVKQAE